jgi:hypothetical protein
MKVKFVRDFRGRATAERFYTCGEVVDLLEWQAETVVAEAAAVPVVEVAETVTPPAVSATPRPPARKRATKTRRGLIQ